MISFISCHAFAERKVQLAYRNWMNSLGVDPFVQSLYDDLRNGAVFCQLFDKIQPGVVNWKRVTVPPFPRLGALQKQIENCNYAVELGSAMKFSMIGIAGKDLVDGNAKLTLALVWQMMRAYVLSILASISPAGERIQDADILAWANKKVRTVQYGAFSNISH